MLIVDIIKLLVSKDTRDTVSAIAGAFRTPTDWKSDLIVVRDALTREQEHKAVVLISFALRSLREKEWTDERIDEVRFVVDEITRNAFRYGFDSHDVSKRKGTVKVELSVSKDFFSLAVKDPGSGFDLAQEVQRQLSQESSGMQLHALGVISRMGVQLSQSTDKKGVRAIMKPHPVRVEVADDLSSGDVTDSWPFRDQLLKDPPRQEVRVLRLSGDIDAFSAQQTRAEIGEVIADLHGQPIVIDMREAQYVDSAGLNMLMHVIKQLNSQPAPSKFAFCVEPDRGVHRILCIVRLGRYTFTSMDEAIDYCISTDEHVQAVD